MSMDLIEATEPVEMQEGYLPLLNAEAVAERLSVPKTWVYRAGREGIIPCVRMGRYMRFRREDVERFIASGGIEDDGQGDSDD